MIMQKVTGFGAGARALWSRFRELILYGGNHNWITVPHVENAKTPKAIYKFLSLGVDKRVQTSRLPLYGSVIPASGHRFSIL